MASRKRSTEPAAPEAVAAARGKRSREFADTESIVVPSVRTYRIWTPGQVRHAEQQADQGFLRNAVDLCDWILADDKVRGALDGRISGWSNAPLTFDGSGDRRRRQRAVKALEIGEDWDAMFPAAEQRQINQWALVLGCGPWLNRWQVLEEHDKRDIPVAEFYHPQSLRYEWYRRTWIRQIADTGREEPFAFGDGVWCAHMPFGTFRPWSLGLWRALARWVLLKAYAISDWGRLGETATRNVVEQDMPEGGDGVMPVVDEGSSKQLRKELATDISKMSRESTLILPPGFHYKLVEQGAATKELFSKQIEMADLGIAICIRGGNLSTNVEGGSHAAAKSQERTAEFPNRKDDSGAWVTTTRAMSLVFWADANYGDRKLAPWAQYDTDPPEDRKQKADVLVTALQGEAAARTAGYKVKRKEFTEAFGFEEFLDPGKEPEPVDPTTLPGQPGKPDDKGGKAPKPGEKATALARLRLASGDSLRKGKGFIEGQLFADALTERGAAAATTALEPTIEAILEELDAATDYDDLRERLRARYEKLDPEQLSDIVFAVMALGELAGRVSINQDA